MLSNQNEEISQNRCGQLVKTGLTTLDIAEVRRWFPEICVVFCVFLSVSPFYFPLILKPDMISNSFRSVFLNTLLEKALRTACAVKDLLRNTCRRVGYVAYFFEQNMSKGRPSRGE